MIMPLITTPLEPKRLILAWQSGRPDSSRRFWDVAALSRDTLDAEAPVRLRYFDRDVLAPAIKEGFDGYPAFNLKQIQADDVLDTFMRRLPPRKRPDFGRYLETLGVSPNATFTDFALLGASEARLPSDGFALINPMDDQPGQAEFLTEIAGHRHMPGAVMPAIGEIVSFEPEPANPKDPNAVIATVATGRIGWVSRIQAMAFQRWMKAGRLSATVFRINGTSERPRIHLRVTLAAATMFSEIDLSASVS